MDPEVIVATLGFDADFVLRRLMRGASGRVVLLALRVDESSWARVDSAFKLIQAFCSYNKVDCTLEPVSTTRSIVEIYSILRREVEKHKSLELFLTGGPRIMVVSTLIASLLLLPEHAEKVKVVVEGEAFPATIEVDIGILQKLLLLDEAERRILVALLQYDKGLTAPKIVAISKVPKTSTYRKLKTLETLNLLERDNGRYMLTSKVREALKNLIIPST